MKTVNMKLMHMLTGLTEFLSVFVLDIYIYGFTYCEIRMDGIRILEYQSYRNSMQKDRKIMVILFFGMRCLVTISPSSVTISRN